jgi:hypothetical protein
VLADNSVEFFCEGCHGLVLAVRRP